MPKHLVSTLVAGLVSGGIFLLVVGAGLGSFFMFLATLPLFVEGLGKSPRAALYSALAASVTITAVTAEPEAGVLFLLMFGLPAWAFIRLALLSRMTAGGTQWFPAGNIIVHLTMCAVAALALITAFCAMGDESFAHIMGDMIHEAAAGIEDGYGAMVEAVARQWLFLIVAMTVWLWVIALYAHAWIAERFLKVKQRAIRPDLAVTPFIMPHWMLSLLGICALASLIGGESMRFLGKTALMSLMLPYFFLGAALMHESSKTWPSRRFFLIFIYVLIFFQFWPALILSGIGLWHHIKRLSAAPGSSKS